jgi:hypothetical protein
VQQRPKNARKELRDFRVQYSSLDTRHRFINYKSILISFYSNDRLSTGYIQYITWHQDEQRTLDASLKCQFEAGRTSSSRRQLDAAFTGAAALNEWRRVLVMLAVGCELSALKWCSSASAIVVDL